MDVIDEDRIAEELNDLFSNPEAALNELQYPVAQHIISLRMEHELPWQDSDAGYATLGIVGDFYPTAYVMNNFRVIFMQEFAEIVT